MGFIVEGKSMQAIVENGKVIANGIAYLVPEVKDGTKVVLTLNAYSSKFCLVNYKDKKGVMQSHKAIAEFVMPDEHVQTTTGRVASPQGCKSPSKVVASEVSKNRINARVLWRGLCKKLNISEYRRINQEAYDKMVRHMQLGVSINCSAKLLGVTRKTIESYRDIYHLVAGHGYKMVLIPNTNKKVKALSAATLEKIGA